MKHRAPNLAATGFALPRAHRPMSNQTDRSPQSSKAYQGPARLIRAQPVYVAKSDAAEVHS